MIVSTAMRIDTSAIEWPAPVEIAEGRVIDGTPRASTLTLEETPHHQVGLWRVSPGGFVTDHTGYLEYIHILSGSGSLVSDSGNVIPLAAGITVLMPAGWKGRWVIAETITKVFTLIYEQERMSDGHELPSQVGDDPLPGRRDQGAHG